MSTDALPNGGGYVVAAYLVLTALLLAYFAIMAVRLRRLERDVVELHELLDERDGAATDTAATDEPAAAAAGLPQEPQP